MTLRDGTYRENINFRKSGQSRMPITFRGMPGKTAVMTTPAVSVSPCLTL